jgi:predicted Rossmann fold nucleotide-binding protein DprA/Smf involved in DNA uptake
MVEPPRVVGRESADYPANIELSLGEESPPTISLVGNAEIFASDRKTALFCSSKCPGRLVLKTYDVAQKLRADGRTVISGFHSPMEKECLDILLRSPHPVIVCLARGLDSMRIPSQWKKALDDERLLI